jgi:hypothetical protein
MAGKGGGDRRCSGIDVAARRAASRVNSVREAGGGRMRLTYRPMLACLAREERKGERREERESAGLPSFRSSPFPSSSERHPSLHHPYPPSMDPSSPPPPLQLLPLLADVSSWLSLPASSSEQPSSSTAASFISSANRQAGAAGGLLGGLLGGSNSSRSSLGDGGDGIETTRPEKRVRCRWVEGYGSAFHLPSPSNDVAHETD